MPFVKKNGQSLTLDLSDLIFARVVPWDVLTPDGEAALEIEDLRERLFDFMDIVEAQKLAQKRDMCMNYVHGRVCQARAAYVLDRHILLCEACWNNFEDCPAEKVRSKVEF